MMQRAGAAVGYRECPLPVHHAHAAPILKLKKTAVDPDYNPRVKTTQEGGVCAAVDLSKLLFLFHNSSNSFATTGQKSQMNVSFFPLADCVPSPQAKPHYYCTTTVCWLGVLILRRLLPAKP